MSPQPSVSGEQGDRDWQHPRSNITDEECALPEFHEDSESERYRVPPAKVDPRLPATATVSHSQVPQSGLRRVGRTCPPSCTRCAQRDFSCQSFYTHTLLYQHKGKNLMHSDCTPDADDLLEVMKKLAEERKWHLKYAKFNWRVHQSLLAHCLSVSSLSSSLLDCLGELNYVQSTEKLRLQVALTGFLHDAGKESESFQGAVEDFLASKGAEPLDFGHQQDGDLRPVIESLKKDVEDRLPLVRDLRGIWEEVIWSISQMGRRENAGAVSHSFERAPSNDALICKELVHLADVMMSKLKVEDVVSVSLDGQIVSKLQLTYSKVSVVRGVLTQFLHAALESQLTDAGFRPVQWFPNGTVYIGRAGAQVPHIDSAKLVESVVKKMQDVLDKSSPFQMAKAAYGDLRAQVIAAPEFLFANNESIREFWKNISGQRFAKPSSKKPDELKEAERKVYQQISGQLDGKDESTKLTYLARFLSDFNLLIVLYAARKQLVENAENVGVGSRAIEEEATKRIQETFAQVLRIPSTATWPEVALQNRAEKCLPVAKTLWLSPYYENPADWKRKFLEALEKATVGLADLWRQHIPDRCTSVARLLMLDVAYPLDPKAVMEAVGNLNTVIVEGKTGHGTPTCQRCGGVAVHEAQAELFGKSEIYHDDLVAGSRRGGGNKIQVCELCEFEEKLHAVFMTRGQEPFSTFYIFPHLALSRNQQLDWQKTVDKIKLGPGWLPPLLRVHQWAELVMEGNITSLSLSLDRPGSFFSEKELARAIQEVGEEEGLEGDLSSMIDPPLDAKDGKAVASYLSRGRCALKERFGRQVYKILIRLEPFYLSPNFVLLLTNGTVADRDEPESSVAIKWTFFRCILARLFSATVLGGDSIREEGATLGYTTVPSNIVLKPLTKKLNSAGGWIPIPNLERALKKLSALILAARELSNADAGYGKSTLLHLLDEEPGRILVRMTNRNRAYPKRFISYLDAWNDRE